MSLSIPGQRWTNYQDTGLTLFAERTDDALVSAQGQTPTSTSYASVQTPIPYPRASLKILPFLRVPCAASGAQNWEEEGHPLLNTLEHPVAVGL